MKKLSAVFAALLVMLYSAAAFAANPSSIGIGEASSAVDLIVVRKPETKNSATLKKTYGITGTGKNGVKVAYYRFNGSSYIALRDQSDNVAQTKIGSAGVFYKQVSLNEGHNKFAVRAENASGAHQTVYFDINVLNQQVMNNVNGFSNGIQSLYNGWMS